MRANYGRHDADAHGIRQWPMSLPRFTFAARLAAPAAT
jgi:hypothetical protein